MRTMTLALLTLLVSPALAQTPAPTAPALTPAPVQNMPTKDDAALKVDTVRMREGYRVAKIMGGTVHNSQNQSVGTVDDLLLNASGDQVVVAVLSVGGFLGIGNKLVAVPYKDLQIERKNAGISLMLPNATKEALTAMPTFKPD
ncbi:MAG: PRC-barrel domain-containing protein [Rhodospirillales bacterium]|nr:PRC-barrel domain-containing protein [Rhodospirillales bacterium]